VSSCLAADLLLLAGGCVWAGGFSWGWKECLAMRDVLDRITIGRGALEPTFLTETESRNLGGGGVKQAGAAVGAAVTQVAD
jgi:hypothetical protein